MKQNIIIIPARGGSKRLKNKNLLKICNTPMFLMVAKEAMKSKYFDKVYVSSEDKKILNICKENNVKFIIRPKKLSKDNTEKQDVIVHSIKKLSRKIKIGDVVSLQPNSPEFKYKDLDKAYLFFKNKLYPKSLIKEVITVNKIDKIQNAAFRIMTFKTVFQKTLSTKIGVYLRNYIDIHNRSDYLKVKKKLEK